MTKKIFIFLILIIIIASGLRLWKLGEVPSSPDWDEVALGYNSYSIMQTGKDEYGEFLPIILRSFNDYKPALYAYLDMPFIKLLGLNVLAVRLPSAIFGILTVFATYFLIKQLFKKEKLALLSSFLLAISPWHIQFSRIAFEANVGVALNVFGTLFLLKSFKKPRLLLLSAIMFGLSLHTYQSEKVFVPLLILILVFCFRGELFRISKKYLYLSLGLFILILLPLLLFILTNKDALSRATTVSIFSNNSIIQENTDKIAVDRSRKDFLGLIFDNRRVEFVKHIVGGYLTHFDPNWLFVRGDIARHRAPGMGLMYLAELPFLLIGIYMLLFGNYGKSVKFFVFFWLLIAPIPASVTNDVPHGVRTLNFLPTLQVLTAIGLISFLSWLFKIRGKLMIKYPLIFLFTFFSLFNFYYYLNQYFVQQNYFHAKYWQYGYENIVKYLSGAHKDYNKVIVSNTATMDQSYMFLLFYLKYDPRKYLAEGGTMTGQIEDMHKFSNFEFRKFNYYDENEKNILLVGSTFDLPEVFKTVHEVNYPDKTLAIKVVEKNR